MRRRRTCDVALHAGWVLTVLAGLAILGCVGPPSQSNRPPGELAFRQYCQTCHVLPRPARYTDSQWPPLVERYGERAKLSNETQALILDYLLAAN